MLPHNFPRIKVSDLKERFIIHFKESSTKTWGLAKPLLGITDNSFKSARCIFIFPKNKLLISRSEKTFRIDWNCRRYIASDLHQIQSQSHFLICIALQEIT